MHIIKCPIPTSAEKLIIGQKYLNPRQLLKFKFPETNIIINDQILSYIINHHTSSEKGVRKLNNCLDTIIGKVNTLALLGPTAEKLNLSYHIKSFSLPFKLTEKIVDKLVPEKR